MNATYDPKFLYGDKIVPFEESLERKLKRVSIILLKIMQNSNGDTVLAVSHGSTIGLFIRVILGYDEGSKYDMGNCHIAKFEYDNNEFKFVEIIDPIV